MINWIDICQDMITLNEMPKWKFIKRKNMQSIVDGHNKHIYDTDIFTIASEAYSYTQAKYSTEDYNKRVIKDDAELKITLCPSCALEIDKTSWYVIYMPRMNRFEIHTDNISYTIYKNTPIPRILEDSWNNIYDDLKKILINLLLDINMSRLLRDEGGFAIGLQDEYIHRTDSNEEKEKTKELQSMEEEKRNRQTM